VITSPPVLYVEDSGTPAKAVGVALSARVLIRATWHVLIAYDRSFIRVEINDAGPVPTAWHEPVAWFEGGGCSGRGFAVWANDWGGEAAVIGTILYAPIGDPSTATVRSWLRGDGVCENVSVSQLPNARPVVTMPFPPFTPPLRLIVPER
jgi:hypothetical protein